SRSSPAPPALLPPQPTSGRFRRVPFSLRPRVTGAGDGLTGYASPRRSSPTPRLAAARASLSSPSGTRHPDGTGQDVHVLELALAERVETVGSATDACEVTSPAGLARPQRGRCSRSFSRSRRRTRRRSGLIAPSLARS